MPVTKHLSAPIQSELHGSETDSHPKRLSCHSLLHGPQDAVDKLIPTNASMAIYTSLASRTAAAFSYQNGDRIHQLLL